MAEARRFAGWLRTPRMQAWIAQSGKGALDAGPTFFPVNLSDSDSFAGSAIALRVEGDGRRRIQGSFCTCGTR